MTSTRDVYILRGPSGCGKSTWAEGIARVFKGSDVVNIVSADHWFTTIDGYEFDPRQLPMAHADCFNRFLKLLKFNGARTIIVDNTNIRKWEYQNYQEAAELAGFRVHFREFITKQTNIAELRAWADRNKHGVPADVIARMAMEFEFEGEA